MKLTKDTVRTLLAVELSKQGCTMLDAEDYFVKQAMTKESWDPLGAVGNLATAVGLGIIGSGAVLGTAGYKMYDSMKNSDEARKKKLVERDQYRQARKDLENSTHTNEH